MPNQPKETLAPATYTEIDLQEQRPGESNDAYLGYRCYRDLGMGRSVHRAYNVYIQLKGSVPGKPSSGTNKNKTPSRAFSRFQSEHDWDLRIKDWESKAAQRLRQAQIDADVTGFVDRLERMRLRIERYGEDVADISELIGRLVRGQLVVLSNRAIATNQNGVSQIVGLEPSDQRLLVQMIQAQKSAIDAMVAGQGLWRDAMGLGELVGELKLGMGETQQSPISISS